MVKGEAEINGVHSLLIKTHFRITTNRFLLLTEEILEEFFILISIFYIIWDY